MNLAKVKIWPYALVSSLFIFLGPIFFPEMPLFFLVPSFILIMYQKPLIWCLLATSSAGLFLDLFLSQTFFGLHMISFCLATAIIYPQKKHFFADNLSTLPILTAFMSITITLFQLLLSYLLEKNVVIGLAWILTNLLVMPLLDAGYAFLIFLLPVFLFKKQRRRGHDYFTHS